MTGDAIDLNAQRGDSILIGILELGLAADQGIDQIGVEKDKGAGRRQPDDGKRAKAGQRIDEMRSKRKRAHCRTLGNGDEYVT